VRGRSTRLEHDLLGARAVPSDVYWGIHTLRALENFAVSGLPISRHSDLVASLAVVKQAAATANMALGVLDVTRGRAIVAACAEIRAGALHDHFVVDVVQGGAGTSTNMNANEVIANRALELLGHDKGAYGQLHPLEHVNASQSTNDVYPTAVKLALHQAITRLIGGLDQLRGAFAGKGDEFADAVKLGRTQLQDAVPMTLGQEFTAYAVTITEEQERLADLQRLLCETNIGGAAIGTGLNAPSGYAELTCNALSELTGIPVVASDDLVEATQDAGVFVQTSGALKRCAMKLSKICNDLRLLSSGPRTGLGELRLPPLQAGSSIMPGKVNPVMPELVNQVAFCVMGGDVTVTMAAEAGQLQLNPFEPIIADVLLENSRRLTAAAASLAERCIVGITADRDRMLQNVRSSAGLATVLTPYIGYDRATQVALRALEIGSDVYDLVLRDEILPKDVLDRVLSVSAHGGIPSPGGDVPVEADTRRRPSAEGIALFVSAGGELTGADEDRGSPGEGEVRA
jgi:aspartate ammonia-lyase